MKWRSLSDGGKRAFFYLLLAPVLASGATLTVHNTNGSGSDSLRQAIVDANESDTIDFDTSLAGGTIALGGAPLEILKSLTIDASGLATPITVDAEGASRCLEIRSTGPSPVLVVIDGVRFRRGKAPDGTVGAPGESGGGIWNDGGDLTLRNSEVIDSHAGDGDGSGKGGNGGGVFTDGGRLEIENSTISDNFAGASGATGEGGNGGGVFNGGGTAIITDSTISGNSASESGGGFYGGHGGGLWNDGGGTMTLSGSVVTGNAAGQGDPGSNSVGGGGGGIYNSGGGILNIGTSTISGNNAGAGDATGGAGGGLWNENGTVTITQSTITGNGSGAGAGGGPGGGICNGGSLTVTNSSITGNSTGNGATFYGGSGGGLFTSGPSADLRSSTISGNTTGDGTDYGGDGGGIFADFATTLTVTHCTIVNNQTGNGNGAGGGWGGGLNAFPTQTTISNSVIAGNQTGVDPSMVHAPGPDLYKFFPDAFGRDGANVIGQVDMYGGFDPGTPNANGDFVGTPAAPIDPRLVRVDLPLGAPGDATIFTPFVGSIVIEAGAPIASVPVPTPVDQAGSNRPFGGQSDIGAIEARPFIALNLPDTDMDDIPDAVENFLNQRGLGHVVGNDDSLRDSDFDGDLDSKELQIMTDPLSAGSRFEIGGIDLLSVDSGTGDRLIEVTIPSFPGLGYDLLFGTTLPVVGPGTTTIHVPGTSLDQTTQFTAPGVDSTGFATIQFTGLE